MVVATAVGGHTGQSSLLLPSTVRQGFAIQFLLLGACTLTCGRRSPFRVCHRGCTYCLFCRLKRRSRATISETGPLGFVVSVIQLCLVGVMPFCPSSQSCCGRGGHGGELLAPLLLYRKLGPIVRLGLELPLPTGQGALVVCRAYFLVFGFAHCPCPLPFRGGVARRVGFRRRSEHVADGHLSCLARWTHVHLPLAV